MPLYPLSPLYSAMHFTFWPWWATCSTHVICYPTTQPVFVLHLSCQNPTLPSKSRLKDTFWNGFSEWIFLSIFSYALLAMCKSGSSKKQSQVGIKCAVTFLEEMSLEKKMGREPREAEWALRLWASLTLSKGERMKEGSWMQWGSKKSSARSQTKVFHHSSLASLRNGLP